MLKRYSRFFLGLFFLLALGLRWLYLPIGSVSFAYDQARDAFTIGEILHGHLKILGPPVSGVPGLFHGVLYYYVIAPAYFLGHGNPIAVAYFQSFVSAFGIFVVYFLTKLLTKNKIPSLLAALFFAFSFEASQYSNFLVNASMAVWFVPIFYIGLYLWLTKKSKIAPIIAGLALGLSIQSEVAMAYHIFPLLIWLIIFRKKIIKKELLLFGISFLAAISTMIISEIKFHFTGINGILYLLSGKDGISQTKTLSDYIGTILNQSGKTFAYTLFPISDVFGGLIGFLMIISGFFLNLTKIKKELLTWQTLLISWIFAYVLALPFGGWNMKHILVGVSPAIAVFAAIFFWKYFGKLKIVSAIIIFIILTANLIMIVSINKDGQTLFPLQPDLTLKNEKALVDFTYEKSGGKTFSISSLTSPLYVNTLWSYLYNWYGQSKYGYLPYWVGRDQVGQLGDDLQSASSNIREHFFIIEPTYGIPELYVTYAKGDQDAMSSFISEKAFGQIVVQNRITKQ